MSLRPGKVATTGIADEPRTVGALENSERRVGRFLLESRSPAPTFASAVALDPHSDAGEYSQGYMLEGMGAMSSRVDEVIDSTHRRMGRESLDTMRTLIRDGIERGLSNRMHYVIAVVHPYPGELDANVT
jgi:hypothetical protein